MITVINGDIITSNGSMLYEYTAEERAQSLEQLGIADEIVMLEARELERAIKYIRPKRLVLGTEMRGVRELERALEELIRNGGEAIYHSGNTHYSGTNLLGKSETSIKTRQRYKYIETCEKLGINEKLLIETIERWSESRIVVVGDIILDQYAACEAIGMSAEAPVVVVRELAEENYIGAAAIVAAHIRELGPKVDLISVIGDDEAGVKITSELEKRNINHKLIVDKSSQLQ